MKKFITSLLALSLALSTCMTAFAADGNSATLDGSEEQPLSVDQYYSVEQEGDTDYEDVKMVKVDWTTTVINTKYKTKKTWNPGNRKWETSHSNSQSTAEGITTFTLTNYSSVAVDAEISFAAAEGMDKKIQSVVFNPDTDNTDGMKTIVNLTTPVTHEKDEYAENEFTPVSLASTITISTGAFNGSKTNGNAKLGSYTIKISEAAETKVTGADIITRMRTAAEKVYSESEWIETFRIYERTRDEISADSFEEFLKISKLRYDAISEVYNNLTSEEKALIKIDGAMNFFRTIDNTAYMILHDRYMPADGSTCESLEYVSGAREM